MNDRRVDWKTLFNRSLLLRHYGGLSSGLRDHQLGFRGGLRGGVRRDVVLVPNLDETVRLQWHAHMARVHFWLSELHDLLPERCGVLHRRCSHVSFVDCRRQMSVHHLGTLRWLLLAGHNPGQTIHLARESTFGWRLGATRRWRGRRGGCEREGWRDAAPDLLRARVDHALTLEGRLDDSLALCGELIEASTLRGRVAGLRGCDLFRGRLRWCRGCAGPRGCRGCGRGSALCCFWRPPSTLFGG